jgi:phosphoglucosamine mutase
MSALGVAGDDLPLATGDRIGSIFDHAAGRNRYVGYLISLASHSYKNLRIGLDCANGASWMIAGAVFGALGAQITVVGNQPNGLNINKDCGSTHIENLCRLVREKRLDLGFAFDGDCDRCIAVDQNGKVVDGDAILYILGKRLQARGMLSGNTVVATVMSNSGLDAALAERGIACEHTAVGDRFVYECMQKNDFSLGGEQSGHIIIKKYATTGDGLLTAIMVTEEVCDQKTALSELTKGLVLYPQHTKNLRVKNKDAAIEDDAVQKALAEVRGLIGEHGRALIRKSGTEPLVRVMVECADEQKCKEYADVIADAVQKGGNVIG